MRHIESVLEEYGVHIDYKIKKSSSSVKKNGIIMYKSIPDLVCLALNTNLYKIDNEFRQRGIMVDMSRAKVLKIATLKQIIINSMAFGFNYMTLYIEDLINIDLYDQYGYLRGKYSDNEIKELVNFANNLDYKIVPAIQTLGHLEHVLKWDASAEIRGSEYVLNTDHQQTYNFIEKLIEKIVYLFGNKAINIGMDEAFDLGFWRSNVETVNQKEIFLNHLEKVNKICKKNNIETVKIWSDMMFSIHSNTDGNSLYSNKFNTPLSKIEDNIELIYWNYWTKSEDEYSRILKMHKQFSEKISMALAIHTSMNLFYDYNELECTSSALPACKENGISDILFTMWFEDGGICNLDSIYLGMYETMCTIFNLNRNKNDFESVVNVNYESLKRICSIKQLVLNPMACLWNDPIYDIYYRKFTNKDLNKAIAQLDAYQIENKGSVVEAFYCNLIEYIKLDIKRYLNDLTAEQHKQVEILYKNIYDHIIRQWMNEAKLHGIEDIQKRFELKLYRYKFSQKQKLEEQKKLSGNMKPRFIQLYSPNQWR